MARLRRDNRRLDARRVGGDDRVHRGGDVLQPCNRGDWQRDVSADALPMPRFILHRESLVPDSRARIWFSLFVLAVFCLGGAGGFVIGRHAPPGKFRRRTAPGPNGMGLAVGRSRTAAWWAGARRRCSGASLGGPPPAPEF